MAEFKPLIGTRVEQSATDRPCQQTPHENETCEDVWLAQFGKALPRPLPNVISKLASESFGKLGYIVTCDPDILVDRGLCSKLRSWNPAVFGHSLTHTIKNGGHSVQFSTLSPGISSKSLSLFVTSVSPSEIA